VADVTAVLDDLEINRADYFGYSLGGWIGFGMARYAPDRLHSLILGGAHPYAEDMQPFRDLMPRDPAAFLALIEKVFGRDMTPVVRVDLMANDLDALLVLTQDRTSLARPANNVSAVFAVFRRNRFTLAPNARMPSGPGQRNILSGTGM
jgi:pimeloyl-ACP methyl ester carboxylesterase